MDSVLIMVVLRFQIFPWTSASSDDVFSWVFCSWAQIWRQPFCTPEPLGAQQCKGSNANLATYKQISVQKVSARLLQPPGLTRFFQPQIFFKFAVLVVHTLKFICKSLQHCIILSLGSCHQLSPAQHVDPASSIEGNNTSITVHKEFTINNMVLRGSERSSKLQNQI